MPILIDIKSGPVKKFTAYQLAAYKILVEENMGPQGIPVSQEVQFQDVGHIYQGSNGPYPSVTGILRGVGYMPGIEYASDEDMWRGKVVHKMIHLYNRGTLNEKTLDPILIPYLDAWKQAVLFLGFRYLVGEIPLRSKRYGFAGTLDLYGITKLDLENPKQGILRYGLQLSGDGKYNLYPFHDHRDEQIFLCALTIEQKKIEDRL